MNKRRVDDRMRTLVASTSRRTVLGSAMGERRRLRNTPFCDTPQDPIWRVGLRTTRCLFIRLEIKVLLLVPASKF